MTTLEYISAHLAALAFRVPLSFEAALAPGQAPRTLWAGRWYRDKDQYQKFHYAITGTTRAGKSILLTLYVRSILPTLLPGGSDRRLILYDPKNALHPMLFADAKVPVHYLLPSDARSSRWDVARDCKSPADVTELCEAMIPGDPAEKDKFFKQTLRELSGGTITSLNVTHPHSWDLPDFVRIMECRWALEQVLGRTYGTRHLLRYMNEPRLWANIEATIATELNPLRIIAALWSRTGQRSFSLADFVKGEGILVLGRDPKYGALLDPINALIFKQLFSRLLSQKDSTSRRTYIVIDELAVLGGLGKPLSGLEVVAEQGASRGVVLVVAYHSYADVKALYKDSGEAMLGMLQNQVFLRAADTTTAEFAAKAFGKTRKWMKTTTDTTTSGPHSSSSHSSADHYHEVDTVPYEKFLELPNASPERGITGYWLSPPPLRTARPFHLPGWWIAKNLPPRSDVEPYIERPDRHQYLEPFSYRDLRRLRLTPPQDEGEAKVVRQRPATLPAPPAGDDIAGRLRDLIARPT